MEPPESDGSAPIGGAGAGQSGSGGAGGTAGTAGVGGFMNAGSGGLNPAAGAGGVSGEGGAAGMETAGFGGMSGSGGAGGMATGGMGGTGGAGAGASGDDAGMPDGGTEPEAPVLECEQGRDTVMLLEAALAGIFPYCTAQLPSQALGTPTMTLAVTAIDQGSAMGTTWAGLKNGADECDDGQAFYVDASLDAPRITLCPAFCEALIETGVENVKLELIYGCDPPE